MTLYIKNTPQVKFDNFDAASKSRKSEKMD